MATPLPLSDAFTQQLEADASAAFTAGPELEATLSTLLTTAKTEWPSIEGDDLAFIGHLASHVRPDTSLSGLHATDLYLAFGCLLGDPNALAIFDRTLMSKIPPVMRGSMPAGLTVDDVMQTVRMKLFVRAGETAPKIAGYSGRGALLFWLRATALRIVQDVARAKNPAAATSELPDDDLAQTKAVTQDAELALVRHRYAAQFKQAIQDAMTALSPRDQALLRLHYLDGVSPEDIGRMYQAHRTTVWRWLTTCRETLLAETRRLLNERISMRDQEFLSLMNVLRSQLDVSINRVLRAPSNAKKD